MIKNVTSLVILALVATAPLKAAAAGEEFAAHKAEMMANMDAKIQKLQETKNCVGSAADREAMKKCHESLREFHEGQKLANKEKAKTRIDEKIKKLEAKKAELNQAPQKQ